MICPKCGRPVRADDVICRGCDFILDTGFLGEEILDEDQLYRPGRGGVAPDGFNLDDAVILGDLEDTAQSFETSDSGFHSFRKAGARLYVSGRSHVVMAPDAVPASVSQRDPNIRLTPFEEHILGFIDGERVVEQIGLEAGLDESEVKTALATLADKGVIEVIGRALVSLPQLESTPRLRGRERKGPRASFAALVGSGEDETDQAIAEAFRTQTGLHAPPPNELLPADDGDDDNLDIFADTGRMPRHSEAAPFVSTALGMAPPKEDVMGLGSVPAFRSASADFESPTPTNIRAMRPASDPQATNARRAFRAQELFELRQDAKEAVGASKDSLQANGDEPRRRNVGRALSESTGLLSALEFSSVENGPVPARAIEAPDPDSQYAEEDVFAAPMANGRDAPANPDVTQAAEDATGLAFNDDDLELVSDDSVIFAADGVVPPLSANLLNEQIAAAPEEAPLAAAVPPRPMSASMAPVDVQPPLPAPSPNELAPAAPELATHIFDAPELAAILGMPGAEPAAQAAGDRDQIPERLELESGTPAGFGEQVAASEGHDAKIEGPQTFAPEPMPLPEEVQEPPLVEEPESTQIFAAHEIHPTTSGADGGSLEKGHRSVASRETMLLDIDAARSLSLGDDNENGAAWSAEALPQADASPDISMVSARDLGDDSLPDAATQILNVDDLALPLPIHARDARKEAPQSALFARDEPNQTPPREVVPPADDSPDRSVASPVAQVQKDDGVAPDERLEIAEDHDFVDTGSLPLSVVSSIPPLHEALRAPPPPQPPPPPLFRSSRPSPPPPVAPSPAGQRASSAPAVSAKAPEPERASEQTAFGPKPVFKRDETELSDLGSSVELIDDDLIIRPADAGKTSATVVRHVMDALLRRDEASEPEPDSEPASAPASDRHDEDGDNVPPQQGISVLDASNTDSIMSEVNAETAALTSPQNGNPPPPSVPDVLEEFPFSLDAEGEEEKPASELEGDEASSMDAPPVEPTMAIAPNWRAQERSEVRDLSSESEAFDEFDDFLQDSEPHTQHLPPPATAFPSEVVAPVLQDVSSTGWGEAVEPKAISFDANAPLRDDDPMFRPPAPGYPDAEEPSGEEDYDEDYDEDDEATSILMTPPPRFPREPAAPEIRPALTPAARTHPFNDPAAHRQDRDVIEEAMAQQNAETQNSPKNAPKPSVPSPEDSPEEQRRAKAARLFSEAVRDYTQGRLSVAKMNAKLATVYAPDNETYHAALERWSSADQQKSTGAAPAYAALYQQAQACEKNGDIEQALALLEEGAHRFPRIAAIHNRRGVLLAMHQRDYDAAAIAIKKAIELDPSNLHYKSNYGKIVTKRSHRNRKG